MNRPTEVLVEACVTGEDEARRSVARGAGRLELCRDLSVGGLTPDLDVVRAVCDSSPVPVVVMLRPEAGAFRVAPAQVDRLARTIQHLRDAGAAGIVLGFLTRKSEVDRHILSDLCAAAADLPVTFHRAFDETPRPEEALETLVEAGVTRVLTGGGTGSAWAGRALLARLVRLAAGRTTILAGGAVRGDHVRELVATTGVREVHARARAVDDLCRALAPPLPPSGPGRLA